MNLRLAAETRALFHRQTELSVETVRPVVELERPAKITGLAVQPRDELEVAGLLLPKALLPRQIERAVERGKGQLRLAQGIVGGSQLTERVLLARLVADRAIERPRL